MPLILQRITPPDTRLGVWHASEEPDILLQRLALDPADELRLATIRNPGRRQQWLACRMALSALLNTPSIGIQYTEYGQPLLTAKTGRVSFSHSGTYGAAIFSEKSVPGIDLEPVREKIHRVADRFLAPRELAMVTEARRTEVLTLFWAVKESLYKINGKPDLNIQYDICIESFDYLCDSGGELTARIRVDGYGSLIPVSYQRLNDYILAWTTAPETC